MSNLDQLERQTFQKIADEAIREIVNRLVRQAIGDILGERGGAYDRHEIASELRKVMVSEASRLVAEDAEVKEAFRASLLKKLGSSY